MIGPRSRGFRAHVAALVCASIIAACGGDDRDESAEPTVSLPAASTSTTSGGSTVAPPPDVPDTASELLTCLAEEGVVVASRTALRDAVTGQDADPATQEGLAQCVAQREGDDERRPVGSGILDQPLSVLGGALTILNGDFADPFLLATETGTYGYATNVVYADVPVGRPDPSEGVAIGEALPEVATWSSPGRVWAPAVAETGDGYVLYYTTRHDESDLQCVSIATADDPAGPFVDDTTEPFVCQFEEGGTIGPSPLVDTDGTRYLLFKSDGNCCEQPTTIYAQPLSDDGLSLMGHPER